MSWRLTGAATPATARSSGSVQVESLGRGVDSPAMAGPPNRVSGSGRLKS